MKKVDYTPSPRPWTFTLTPSGKSAIVKGADGSIVCVCHPGNAKDMCEFQSTNQERKNQ